MTRKDGYSRNKMSTYLLPILIFDNDYPIQSSTGTLTIRVCACDNQGNMQSCNAEALVLSAGLSTGALIAILLCVIILLGKHAPEWYAPEIHSLNSRNSLLHYPVTVYWKALSFIAKEGKFELVIKIILLIKKMNFQWGLGLAYKRPKNKDIITGDIYRYFKVHFIYV